MNQRIQIFKIRCFVISEQMKCSLLLDRDEKGAFSEKERWKFMGKKFDEKNGKVSVSFRVDPIKSLKDISRMEQFFKGQKSKRNYCLFVVGINVGLRCSDLTRLKVEDVYDFDADCCKDYVQLVELKTGKDKKFILNKAARDAIELYLKERPGALEGDWLFPSQKGSKLEVKSVNRLLRETGKSLGVKGRLGSHSLRKTFAFHIFKNGIQTDPSIIYTLQKILNHSSVHTTYHYLGIDEEQIDDVYRGLNL